MQLRSQELLNTKKQESGVDNTYSCEAPEAWGSYLYLVKLAYRDAQGLDKSGGPYSSFLSTELKRAYTADAKLCSLDP